MKLLSRDELRARGIRATKTTLWRLEKRGLFPRHINPTPGAVAWLEAEIDAYLENLAKQRAVLAPARDEAKHAA